MEEISMNREDILALEKQMWEATKDRNVSGFLDLVSDQAIMVCGGYRCTGKEYSEIIAFFDCKTYNISNYEIVNEDRESIQIHYLIKLEVNDDKNMDLAGTFHVTSIWRNIEGKWKLVFNMDQRIVEE